MAMGSPNGNPSPMLWTSLSLLAMWTVRVEGIRAEHSCQPMPQSGQTLDDLTLRVGPDGIVASISRDNQGELLAWSLGLDLPVELTNPTACSNGDICWEWGSLAALSITKSSDDQCYEVTWSLSDKLSSARDCFQIGSAKWFSGAEEYFQHFPLDLAQNQRSLVPFLPGDMLQNAFKYYGGVVEPYWLSSKGVSLHVPAGVPLFASWNEQDSGEFCLAAQAKDPYVLPDDDPLVLRYSVCVADNIKSAHEHAISQFLARPTAIPDERMMTHPVWSTWAQYKADINESTVLLFANEIIAHGFDNAQLEIDDNWESCYGDATFSTEMKFPDPGQLVSDLKALGFRVTLWIHPFVNLGCASWSEVAQFPKSYFIQDTKGRSPLEHLPGLVYWWQGALASYVDFTNPKAVEWWGDRLRALQSDYGIDSFKFDAGEINWFPSSYQFSHVPDRSQWPGVFTTKYAESVAEFGGQVEVRVGYRAQHLPIFVRMLDKDSKWGYDNGLKTMITTLLQMNLAGYSFVLPDMIGGNGYAADPLHESEPPTKELFVRWLQANVFMPAMQFSFVPWIYDQEVVDYSKAMAEKHASYAPEIIRLAQEFATTGTPINRPTWWVDPTDETAIRIDSQFMLGDNLLVAPVLEEGAISRDIYLPRGEWRDESNPEHPIYSGPKWLDAYEADLWTLPHFTLIQEAQPK